MTPPRPFPGRRSIRIPGYDYTQPGVYFVTVNTYNRRPLLGRIQANIVRLSRLGRLVRARWAEIPAHFSHVGLDEFVIMPDHIHAVLVLRSQGSPKASGAEEQFGHPTAGSIPTIVRSFKGACTRHVRRALADSRYRLWQDGYYERVIRSEREWDRIRSYIRANPLLSDG
jgi:REP element-mobilizing transposase RayT